MIGLSEHDALAQLQKSKASYQSFIKLNYESAAEDCKTCDTAGQCCTDEHFVNVHITRLEAVAIRETIERTPRLNSRQKRAVYDRARTAVERYRLTPSGDTFSQPYSCPLFEPGTGCLVHRRAKPAPCIQHACYQNWEDLPPSNLQTRVEHRVEQLNIDVYGTRWAWLPTPLWLTLVDPESEGRELERLSIEWGAKRTVSVLNMQLAGRSTRERRRLPVLNMRAARQ